jgi:uncharacterized protein
VFELSLPLAVGFGDGLHCLCIGGLPFVVGLAGSLHCFGMCGPLIIAYSLQVSGSRRGEKGKVPSAWLQWLPHHLAFHFGRLLTYGMLGALAAGVAQVAYRPEFLSAMREVVTLAGGFIMVCFGLALLKVLRVPSLGVLSEKKWSPLTNWVPRLIRCDSLASRLCLGLAVGFLPCMLSGAMIVKAATNERFIDGFLTMAAFGLGTVPVLLFTGFSASVLSIRVRIIGDRVAALSVLAMGILLVLKGVRALL